MSKGLPSRFHISNGRFYLADGVEKSRDNIWFYCNFDKFRVYTSDFGANFLSLVQKPIAYIIANKTIILGSLKKGIQKYVPNVSINSIDIGYTSTNRKEYSMLIEYSSVQDDKTEIKDVMFV